MLFQNGGLMTELSLFENVAFPLREHTDLREQLIRQLVLKKRQAVGLRGAAELMPAELSGGMSRRVALARAIVMDPEILIYDEPFVGLDPISLGVILRRIRRLNDALGITSIGVSHDVQEISTVADLVFLLSGGKAVARGTPQAPCPWSSSCCPGGSSGWCWACRDSSCCSDSDPKMPWARRRPSAS